MNKKVVNAATLFIFFSSVLCSNVVAWDDKVTHKDLSNYASESSVLGSDKGDYLKKLGFHEGLKEEFKWGKTKKTAKKWLQDGAEFEDAQAPLFPLYGTTRSFNHFHNPLKPWDQAGLNDTWTGESSLLWAQDGVYQEGFPEGDWSWQKTRLLYYDALTTQTEESRQAFFAAMFMGLGHQIHLLQDMSVPAHVRNDAHPEDSILGKNYWTGDYYFETWAKKNYIQINSFASSPKFPQVALDINLNNLVPITQFIDSEQYGGTMPSTSPTLGLAEYTNSNFVSDDTIFTEDKDVNNKHYFPFPKYSSANYEMFEVEQSLITKRIYLKKKGDGEYIEHFATTGPLFKFLNFDPVLQKNELKLDEATHNDYASKLIPRAVGYSAGLLNYFFRGDIDLIPAEAVQEKHVIVNNSDEDMNGTFELWYDSNSDQRKKAWTGTYSIGRKNSGNNKSSSFSFDAPDDAKEPGKYMLVLRGKLGAEEEAVVGKAIKLPSKSLLFLINSPNSYAVWEIKDNGVIAPFGFNISNYAQVFANNITYRSVSTLESDDNERLHYYQTQNILAYPYHDMLSDKNRYGKYSNNLLTGSRNDFEPAEWSDDAKIMNNNFDFTRYPTADEYPYYWCSGRHPWGIVGGEVRKNYEIWKNNSSSLGYRYTTQNGIQYGVTPYDITTYPQAIISSPEGVNSAVRYGGTTNYSETITKTDKITWNPKWYCQDNYVTLNLPSTQWDTGKAFQFGSKVLCRVGTTGSSTVNSTEITADNPCDGGDGPGIGETFRIAWSTRKVSNGEANIITYDNEDGDQTFIIIYDLIGNASFKDITVAGGAPDYYTDSEYSYVTGTEYSGTGKIWRLAYCINNGAIITFDLSYFTGYGNTWTMTGELGE